jgi:hypothetical protein
VNLHGVQTENVNVNKLKEVMNDIHYMPEMGIEFTVRSGEK